LTAEALSYYAIGLWAFATVRIVATSFFALQDTRTPMMAAVASIVANFAVGVLLMRSMAHSGLALATSIAAMLNLVILVVGINARLDGLPWRRLLPSILRTVFISALMGIFVWAVAGAVLVDSHQSVILGTLSLIAVVSAGAFFYFGLSWLMNSRELSGVVAEIRKRKHIP
jgi:putative peptidoglycan lipid II flippase